MYIRRCPLVYQLLDAVKSIVIAGHTRPLISSYRSMYAERSMAVVEALPKFLPPETPPKHPGLTVSEQIHHGRLKAVAFLTCQ